LVTALLLAVGLMLASCAGSGSGGSGSGDDMQGMDHGGEGGAKKAQDKAGGEQGMDHEQMDHGSGGMASEMLMENGEYSDERFIDAMVPHHQGAVEMAQVALENAQHREIRALARDVVTAQEAEIERLKSIKEREFGTSEVPMGMSAEEMEMMGMSMSPKELANQDPFDKAFIDNMIPHHESAIDMASVALENTTNAEIKEIARAIVDAQQREIAQMERWRGEWYPEG
jgi:uncharacterized protein (DUF305 family)